MNRMNDIAKAWFSRNDLPGTYRNGSLSFTGNVGDFFNQNTRSETDSSRTTTLNSSHNSRRGPKYPQYSITCIRLSTFQSWPTSIQQHPETMAEAGFYYTGNNDHVRCFHCGIGLQNWDSEDNPFVEHARWSQECQFLKDKKGLDFIATVQDAVRRVQLEEALNTDGIAQTFDSHNSDCEEDGIARSEDKGRDFLPSGKPPKKAEKKNPLLTDAAQSILTMGYLPKVIRIVIDRVLKEKGWNGMSARNLMEEINKIEESGEIAKSELIVPISSKLKHSVVSMKSRKILSKDNVKKIAEENKEMKEQTQCKICCEMPVSIVILPCGHLSSCSQCAPALKSCPVCRSEIKGSVKVQFK
ncbi:putative inhibitor of apoptosis [Mytilus californianus]|uniref:putative inhibitor of apoptosis n=1 Tax=Mytilus californianus TaxID=6549 RepID=UPI0022466CDC|nr:putative inhibitor of apoptosis [Mytilus californianus]XP_052090056.1 putative inhibitor of apoptosis [Mytilus californianus]XP_052090057.1 putative inhibitor of apoptosis [Mytilus californianus]